MIRALTILLILAYSQFSIASERSVIWSTFTSSLNLVSFDEVTSTGTFQGHVVIRGRLYFSFDQLDDDHYGDVLYAKLVPAPEMIERLPYVVSGFYPAPLTYISLVPPDRVLVMTFGKAEAKRLQRGRKESLWVDVEVSLSKYIASVECDSRIYIARPMAIVRSQQKLAMRNGVQPYGC